MSTSTSSITNPSTFDNFDVQLTTNTPSSNVKNSKLTFDHRPSNTRGHANHGWLNSYHTFSFASYYDPKYDSIGPLRVINEDRVAGGGGFPRHSHNNFEIFSYVVSGSLKHDDSMGNSEVLHRGDVQFTSAGTGIAHSEFNGSQRDLVHFLQIWVQPNKRGLTPKYVTKHFDDQDKLGKLCKIVGVDQGEHITINQDINVYASILQRDQSLTIPIQSGRQLYIHVIQDVISYDKEEHKVGITVTDLFNNVSQEVLDGDGLRIQTSKNNGGSIRIDGSVKSRNGGSRNAEFLVFDIAD